MTFSGFALLRAASREGVGGFGSAVLWTGRARQFPFGREVQLLKARDAKAVGRTRRDGTRAHSGAWPVPLVVNHQKCAPGGCRAGSAIGKMLHQY